MFNPLGGSTAVVGSGGGTEHGNVGGGGDAHSYLFSDHDHAPMTKHRADADSAVVSGSSSSSSASSSYSSSSSSFSSSSSTPAAADASVVVSAAVSVGSYLRPPAPWSEHEKQR